MTLPRFTSGKVGKLEFHHLNEAFDRIENVDPSMPYAKSNLFGRAIIARVESYQGTGVAAVASFKEYALDSLGSATYVQVAGGVTSTNGTDDFATPIVYPLPPIGSIVPIVPGISRDGKLYFKTVASESASTRIGKVETAGTLIAGRMWLYNMKEVAFDLQANVWTNLPGAFQAINGCENPIDDIPNRQIGVGTIFPSGANATRKPIKDGTVVSCSSTAGYYLFNVPNGYEFTCI